MPLSRICRAGVAHSHQPGCSVETLLLRVGSALLKTLCIAFPSPKTHRGNLICHQNCVQFTVPPLQLHNFPCIYNERVITLHLWVMDWTFQTGESYLVVAQR